MRLLLLFSLALTGLDVASAQIPQAEPEFEAAAIKLAPPSDSGDCGGGPGTTSPAQFTCHRTRLSTFVLWAWGLSRYQLTGPAVMDNTEYTIVAKVPHGATRPEFNRMLQRLLQQSLQLTYHYEKRQQTVYDLVIAKAGLKMQEAQPKADASGESGVAASGISLDFKKYAAFAGMAPGVPAVRIGHTTDLSMRVVARWQGMELLRRLVEGDVGTQVTDRTGLTGKYDFVLRFVSDWPLPNGKIPDPLPQGPSIAQALVEQLGLKLESHKGSVDILVVDGFKKEPLDN